MIFEGLAGTEKSGTGAPDDPVQLALARIRQLAAHEVGHSLGLSHNFAASTYGRASVMDYPAPLVGVTPDGKLDFSKTYAVGVGEWDVQAIRYAYGEFPPGTDEKKALGGVIEDGLSRGLVYLTDEDARPEGSASPLAHLWDNGPNAAEGLRNALAVRRIGLNNFGEHNVAPGQPLALLNEVLVPVYFHHRYQLEAAAKVVGGLQYTYALRGDGQPASKPVDGEAPAAGAGGDSGASGAGDAGPAGIHDLAAPAAPVRVQAERGDVRRPDGADVRPPLGRGHGVGHGGAVAAEPGTHGPAGGLPPPQRLAAGSRRGDGRPGGEGLRRRRSEVRPAAPSCAGPCSRWWCAG